ncbi:beta strand repeat-containing protein [Winogradskyella forsetii]|uniref:beta strand repeat-containing protein n=1 Tax=Winogradskyella forsetii TaxID=2686077 RepID=UPI0015B86093|nr:hypothetical protein [Winogradskyella forsetii]
MKTFTITLFLILSCFAFSQVGVGNTNPKASLDISASNTTTPTNEDGILIPRIDNFPTSNPSTDQDGMMVFVTGNGTAAKGFYYWNQATTSWNSIAGAKQINDLNDGKSDNDGSDDGSSLFLGVDAGANDDSSNNRNVGIGFQALQSNTFSWGNTAIGNQAMQANTSGMNNTATGAGSLSDNLSGVDNAAFGNTTLSANTSGSFNSAIGFAALNSNTNGNYNIALGYWTLLNNNSGDRNVALGSSSGYTNTTGSNNVFIGYQSGYFETGSEKLYIENSNSDSNNALIYGEFDNNILRTNGELQIGNPTITGYAFPSTDGTNGQVLTTDGSGNVSFQNTVGDGTGTDNQNLTAATLTGTTLNLGIQNGTGTSVNLASLTDDSDWVPVGANIERQSGDVYIGNTNATNNNIYISNNIIDWDDTNYYLNPDDMSVMDEIQFDNGTAADPSIFFKDINTGFFSPSNAVTAYSVNGNESFRIQNDGEISIGLIGATNYKFSLNSLINQNTIRIGNDVFSSDNFVDIYHSAQRGNAMNISVNDPYSLASRSGISVFNELGDTNVDIAKYATGSSNIYGLEIYIPEDIVGTEYGVYSNVLTTNGYAAYFLGEVSLGTTSGNTYSLPNSRGTNGQVMQTDGLGNVTWQNPTTNTDNQQIDSFSFNSSTNELTLEIEDDGQPPQIVDLSGLNPQKAIARLFMSASQTETGSGITKVNFDAAQFDIGSNFNMTTDAYEIPETAIYRVTAQITMDASTGTGTFDVRIRVNGTQERRAEYNHTGNGQIVRQITSILSLAAGDTLDIAFNRPAIGATIQANSRATFFEIEQL